MWCTWGFSAFLVLSKTDETDCRILREPFGRGTSAAVNVNSRIIKKLKGNRLAWGHPRSWSSLEANRRNFLELHQHRINLLLDSTWSFKSPKFDNWISYALLGAKVGRNVRTRRHQRSFFITLTNIHFFLSYTWYRISWKLIWSRIAWP